METRNQDAYTAQRAAAEEDGTALPERTDDLPPADLGHTARDLAAALRDVFPDRADEIGVPEEVTLWERLDVARAASYLRRHHPDRFTPLISLHPWLEDAAESTDEGAMGALADQF